MKKFLLLFILVFTFQTSAQIEDRFSYLLDQDLKNFARPLATSLGVGFNSAGYNDAKISKLFGFSFGFRGMVAFIPDEQLTFKPEGLPEFYTADQETATIYGGSGSSYAGPAGYLSYPSGINQDMVPLVYPQMAFSMFGTELMVRFLPEIPVGDEKLKLLGFGVSHSVSQYFPLLPVNIAVQFMYNSLSVTNIIEVTNTAFNAHVSKTFGVFIAYGGLQFENTSVDFEYTYQDPNGTNPELDDTKVKLNLEGDNKVRLTVGGALRLAFFVLNADYSLGSQNVLSGGLSFEF